LDEHFISIFQPTKDKVDVTLTWFSPFVVAAIMLVQLCMGAFLFTYETTGVLDSIVRDRWFEEGIGRTYLKQRRIQQAQADSCYFSFQKLGNYEWTTRISTNVVGGPTLSILEHLDTTHHVP